MTTGRTVNVWPSRLVCSACKTTVFGVQIDDVNMGTYDYTEPYLDGPATFEAVPK